MKITTYIDEQLLKRAFKASRAKTKREVLENGLRSLLSEIQRNTFISEFDHLRLRISPEELAHLRA